MSKLTLKLLVGLLVLPATSLFSQARMKSTFMGSSLIHMPSTEDIGKDN